VGSCSWTDEYRLADKPLGQMEKHVTQGLHVTTTKRTMNAPPEIPAARYTQTA